MTIHLRRRVLDTLGSIRREPMLMARHLHRWRLHHLDEPLLDWANRAAAIASQPPAVSLRMGDREVRGIVFLHDAGFSGPDGSLLLAQAMALARLGQRVVLAAAQLNAARFRNLAGQALDPPWGLDAVELESLHPRRRGADVATADFLLAMRRRAADLVVFSGHDWSPLPADLTARIADLGPPTLRWRAARESLVVDDAWFRPVAREGARLAAGLGNSPVILTSMPDADDGGFAARLHSALLSGGGGALSIWGEGAERTPCSRAFAGLSPAVRLAALNAADLYVSPRRDGAVDAILLEAMACGLPVVVAPGGSAAELIDARAGRVAGEASPEALARAARLLLGDPEARHAAGGAVRRLIEERHGLAAAAHWWTQTLADAAGS